MRCPRCGDATSDSDRFCSSCGQDQVTYRELWPKTPTDMQSSPATDPAHAAAAPPAEATRPPTYLGWAAALVTVCWPAFWAGIPAVIYAGRAETQLDAGDLAGAQESARKARAWCWVTFWAGLALWVLILTLVVTL